MKNLFILGLLAVVISSCSTSGNGELIGVQNRPIWNPTDPYGMVYIPQGSFNMGPGDQDVPYAHVTQHKTVSVAAFYMDETEITNNEYRQFVNWVRDSIARILLGEAGIAGYELIEEDKYDNFIDPPIIDWNRPIRWDDQEVREVLEDEMYLPDHERFYSRRQIDSRKLNFVYETQAIKDAWIFKCMLKTIENVEKTPYIQELEMNLEAIEKGGYEHFMLKEIFEQPKSIADSMRGRLDLVTAEVKLGGIADYQQKIINADRIIIVACGTSWHAGLIAEYLFEDLARIPVEVEYASEFRYRNPIITEKDIVLAISQSGETADTLAAMKLAKEKGATVLGVCNVVGSSIARLSDAGSYTHAGPEIGVASTKAFTAQVTVLTLMSLMLGRKKGTIAESYYRELIAELSSIPDKVESMIGTNDYIEELSSKFKDAHNFLYLGRGYNFPVALEGALKLKEISYIHAEGYPAAEMKHGPIALIDENMPIVVIATKKGHYEKVVSNIQEVKARNGIVIAVVTQGDTVVKEIADFVIEIPEVAEPLVPILSNIPLQLLSYHIAVMRGCNVDQPRNLAKSVTVE